MTTTLSQLNHHNPFSTAWFFALAVLILLPALLFSSFVPEWAPPVALVGLAIIFALRGLATGRVIGHTPVDWPLLLLFLLLLVSLWITTDLSISLPLTYTFIANLAFFWAVAAQRNTPWLHRSGWLLLLAGLILAGVFLLGTNFSRTKLPFINQEVYTVLPGGFRPFWNPEGFNANLSGGLLALFWPPAVALIWRGNSWQQRDVAKLVAVVLGGLLVLTQSRGALLGGVVALLVITLLQSRRWLWFWWVVLAVVIIEAYHLGPDTFLETILGRSDIFGDRSLQGRQELWERSMYLMDDFPLTGVGLGMVESTIKQHYPTNLIRPDGNFKHVHNIYLQAGAEMGLPGLMAYLAFYLILFHWLLRRALDRQAGYNQALALGLLGSLIIFLTHGFFEVITFAPRAAIVVWGLFGLMVAVATSPVNQLQER
jgi:putative inorganic carbon (HCO3(-)) transporter